MSIAVVGAGAMGQFFATSLSKTQHEVVLIDVVDEVISRINSEGITVGHRGVKENYKVRAAFAHELSHPVEIVLFFTKSFQIEQAAFSIRHIVGDETQLLTLQNGVGNAELLAKLFPTQTILMGMTDYPVDRSGLSEVSVPGEGEIILGRFGCSFAETETSQIVANLFRQAGLNASTHPNVVIPMWEKLVFNAVLNSIGGATGLTVGQVGSEAHELVRSVLAEALAVTESESIPIDEKRVRKMLQRAFETHSGHKTSMTLDVAEGRATEIDSIGGALVAVGSRRKVMTPVLKTLCEVIRLRTALG